MRGALTTVLLAWVLWERTSMVSDSESSVGRWEAVGGGDTSTQCTEAIRAQHRELRELEKIKVPGVTVTVADDLIFLVYLPVPETGKKGYAQTIAFRCLPDTVRP